MRPLTCRMLLVVMRWRRDGGLWLVAGARARARRVVIIAGGGAGLLLLAIVITAHRHVGRRRHCPHLLLPDCSDLRGSGFGGGPGCDSDSSFGRTGGLPPPRVPRPGSSTCLAQFTTLGSSVCCSFQSRPSAQLCYGGVRRCAVLLDHDFAATSFFASHPLHLSYVFVGGEKGGFESVMND